LSGVFGGVIGVRSVEMKEKTRVRHELCPLQISNEN